MISKRIFLLAWELLFLNSLGDGACWLSPGSAKTLLGGVLFSVSSPYLTTVVLEKKE